MNMAFSITAPSLEDQWRAIILFGANSASYKFALAKALLELKPVEGQILSLEELALPFAQSILQHLKEADRQGTASRSQFLDSCRAFNQGLMTETQLREETVKQGFVHVLDAFHRLNSQSVPEPFFLNLRKSQGGIQITEAFSSLMEGAQSVNLNHEVEARWRLVERAWELRLSSGLLGIGYDVDSETLYSIDQSQHRKPVTSSRSALNGYQQGKCFYCFEEISLEQPERLPDVDHFFPHTLKRFKEFGHSVDGVWNLVLACQQCNRGVGGKFAQIPTLSLLERLYARNEFLIGSHHPLRETLILQTGKTSQARQVFLNDWYNRARIKLIHTWEPK